MQVYVCVYSDGTRAWWGLDWKEQNKEAGGKMGVLSVGCGVPDGGVQIFASVFWCVCVCGGHGRVILTASSCMK